MNYTDRPNAGQRDHSAHWTGSPRPATIDDYLHRLEGVTQSGDGYKALCPAHDDRNPSLSIGPGKNGHPVLYCHAGCSYDSIIAAIGMDRPDPRQHPKQSTRKKIVATYDYCDEQGVLLYQKVRYAPKDFSIRRPDGDGWTWKKGNPRPILYRLPEVMQAITTRKTIFIPEGEKDADRLHSLGLTATTTIEGASEPGKRPKWRSEYSDQLKGASRVVLLADNDPPGKAHAEHIAQQLVGRVADIRLVELPGLPAKGDVSDWLDAGHTVKELFQLVEVAETYRPDQSPATSNATEASVKDDIETTAATIEQDAYRGTDDANADLFLGIHGRDVRYCPPWEKWLLWTGTHWRMDDRLDIDRLAADTPRLLYRHAADARDTADRRKIADLARKLESTHKRNSMLAAARHRVVVHHSDLNKGKMLLNVANGTIDLETGTLQPHHRSDLITHDTEIFYSPDATAPTWLQFLADVFAHDQDLIDFVQRAVGYSLTGDVREQIVLICHGAGSNGKSKFLTILRRLLGSLSWQAASDLLLQDKYRRHPTEQADLFGKRVVVCQETGDGRRFNEALVKQLTGGDAITARRMHEDNWSFEPTHKLWLSTNHKPEIRGTDHAIWRRMRLLPFGVTFGDDTIPRKDPAMEVRLLAELPGILAWAVQGCLAWQRDGLRQAEAVKQATEAYRSEMDVLAGFLADCCVIDRNARVKAGDLYNAYRQWCDQGGERAETQRKFGQRLTERGFERRRSTGNTHFWYGLELSSDLSDPSDPEMHKKGCSTSCRGDFMQNRVTRVTRVTEDGYEEGEL